MRRVPVLGALAAACATPPPEPATPQAIAVMPKTPSQVESRPTQLVPSAAWSLALRRYCTRPDPVASVQLAFPPGRRTFVYCSLEYDVDLGSRVGFVGQPSGFIDGRAIFLDWGAGGFRLSLGDPHDPIRTYEGGYLGTLAVRSDDKQILSIERSNGAPQDLLVLRAMPTGEVLRSAVITAEEPYGLGFMADGTPIALQEPEPRLVTLNETGKLEPVGTNLDDVRAFAVDRRGQRALVARGDGRIQIVSLPDGSVVETLPVALREDEPSVGLALFGSMAAVSGNSIGVRLFTDGEATRLSDRGARYLRFSPDGQSLYAHGGDAYGATVLDIFRPGGDAGVLAPPSYAVTPPAGFELEPAQLDSSLRRGDVLARYVREDGAEVVVRGWDAREFARAQGLDDWAKLVGVAGDDTELWGDALGGRGAQTFYARREGCDPMDFYTRVLEQGPWVYQVQLRVLPGSSYEDVEPLVEAFFDRPFGAPPKAATAAFELAANNSVEPDWPC